MHGPQSPCGSQEVLSKASTTTIALLALNSFPPLAEGCPNFGLKDARDYTVIYLVVRFPVTLCSRDFSLFPQKPMGLPLSSPYV